MSNEIRNLLDALARKISQECDRIHPETIVILLSQGRATGQRTRMDRVNGAQRRGG